ncbi:DinB superfamily protein [Paenibacillus uliginis N3/975]|uniref:DinB superfamily protein n=1 Tax=Paenibacillus uliginis N3/975 TaxID=1313296 RepID=A0A1X7H2D5_9BACL|nr:DinB family protein [Paenibacillus uliginis]SMF77701.1 DinB superfamily protein [Paenibacillus uliginis N3/975]
MTFTTVSQIWNAVQDRFHQTAKNLPEQDLPLKLGNASIGYMLRHNAEVEYMFADWFFNRPLPEGLIIHTARGAAGAENEFTNLEELLAILKASNEHMIQAMRELPDEKWNEPVKSPMGISTPLEAVGRLMYHTGIHAGQISLIQKCATAQRP